jgi:riboflavin kinase/FMN adenylyltransferase
MSASSILQNDYSSPVLLSPRPVLEGEVVHGDARGRTLGFPTANMEFSGEGLPAFGVYAVRVRGRDSTVSLLHDGVASFGIRPMFRTSQPLLETHLFDFQGDLYGHVLAVELVAWLRPEVKFSGLETLVAQIAADAAQARHILAATSDHVATLQGVLETVA